MSDQQRDPINTHVHSAAEIAEFVAMHNPQPPVAGQRRAAYRASRRKEQARVQAIWEAHRRRGKAAA